MAQKKIRNVYNMAEGKCFTATVPGSKSITNRSLLLSVLADGCSTLHGVLFSDDSRHFMDCVKELGFDATIDEDKKEIKVWGSKGKIPQETGNIYVGSAGTAARFLTALLGMSKGSYHLDSSEQMKKRPMAPLLATLEEMGTDIVFDENEGYFPFTLTSDGIIKTDITVNIDTSSQFLSAILISACCTGQDMNIHVTGEHGMAYIDMTVKMMEQFGICVNHSGDTFTIKGGQCYKAKDYVIEPDVSAACYFYGMAAILGSTVVVENVHFDSMQGDVQFISYLEQMGCIVEDTEKGIKLTGPEKGHIKGIKADMHSCSDQAITMAAIAPFADEPVTITGIGHIKYQESDRMNAIITELGKMGIKCESTQDSITIYPGVIKPSVVSTYDDHRMAMGFSLIGLRADQIVIDDPGCCRKTFENYFECLDNVLDNYILG